MTRVKPIEKFMASGCNATHTKYCEPGFSIPLSKCFSLDFCINSFFKKSLYSNRILMYTLATLHNSQIMKCMGQAGSRLDRQQVKISALLEYKTAK